jgi:hypothetical protein
MKLQIVKQTVFSLTCTLSTKQLKQERPELTKGRDLRYKAEWVEILKKIKTLRTQDLDMSLTDLEQSEEMLKASLFRVGRISGLGDEELELDWQRIQLEVQFGDIHIEEL